VEGLPYQKPKHSVGAGTLGLDLGPSTIAIVPQEGESRLLCFCAELKPNQQKKRRLQRKLDRQRRANNPQNYDQQGWLAWKDGQGYKTTRRRLASQERKLASHRKSLHGRLVHEVVACGTTIITEHLSYRAWQKQYGKSVGAHAPGMFLEQLRRTGASNWRHPRRKYPRPRPDCLSTATAAAATRRSRSRNAGTTAPVALARCSATCMQRC
jgi:hypothetical protein